MSDIVERLRKWVPPHIAPYAMLQEAADEIERLRAKLATMKDQSMGEMTRIKKINLEWYRTFLAPYERGFPHMNRLCDEIERLQAERDAIQRQSDSLLRECAARDRDEAEAAKRSAERIATARREERERCLAKAREIARRLGDLDHNEKITESSREFEWRSVGASDAALAIAMMGDE